MTTKILRFTASWCQPCKMLAKNLEGADVGAPIEVIDIDVHTETAMEYGIRGVPTLIYIKDGAEVGRVSGVKSATDIKTWVESL